MHAPKNRSLVLLVATTWTTASLSQYIFTCECFQSGPDSHNDTIIFSISRFTMVSVKPGITGTGAEYTLLCHIKPRVIRQVSRCKASDSGMYGL